MYTFLKVNHNQKGEQLYIQKRNSYIENMMYKFVIMNHNLNIYSNIYLMIQ